MHEKPITWMYWAICTGFGVEVIKCKRAPEGGWSTEKGVQLTEALKGENPRVGGLLRATPEAAVEDLLVFLCNEEDKYKKDLQNTQKQLSRVRYYRKTEFNTVEE